MGSAATEVNRIFNYIVYVLAYIMKEIGGVGE